MSWYGWETQTWDSLFPYIGYKCPDFHVNVNNAFRTAPILTHFLTTIPFLQKEQTIVAAHSLGNTVVSTAIQDFDFHADRYMMINPAVTQEAYSRTDDFWINSDMVHRDWAVLYNAPGYQNKNHRFFAWDWYRLFVPHEDIRSSLTWNGRFADVPERTRLVNLWSRGDRTFYQHRQAEGIPVEDFQDGFGLWGTGLKAFSRQEKGKGIGSIIPHTEIVAGWGVGDWGIEPGIINAQNFPDDILVSTPGFSKGSFVHSKYNINPAHYVQLFNSIETYTPPPPLHFNRLRNALLAAGIPAKQNGMGHAANYDEQVVGSRIENIEIEGRFNNGGWFTNQAYPNDEIDNDNEDAFWDHGHFQTVALPYTVKFYYYLIQNGGLR